MKLISIVTVLILLVFMMCGCGNVEPTKEDVNKVGATNSTIQPTEQIIDDKEPISIEIQVEQQPASCH